MSKLVLVLFLLCGLKGFTQESVPVPQPKPISKQDLLEKAHPKDTSAVAAYKYRHGKTWFEQKGDDWLMVTEVYTRIKIYKKEGYNYANAQIAYYSGMRKAKGFFSEANTYNIVNDSIAKTPLKKDSEFEEDSEEDVTIRKIVMPNVKEGSIIEYKYTIKTPFFSELQDWYFQFRIPAEDVRYDVFIPTYLKYNIYSTGFIPIERSEPKVVHNRKLSANEQYYSYWIKDVKAIKDEDFVDNVDDYISTVRHEIASVNLPGYIPKNISTDWGSLLLSIYTDRRFGKEMDLRSYFQKDIDLLLKKDYTPRQKADSIFAFVQDRMTWNEYVGYFCRKGVEKAYVEKTGNAAEINLMLIAMLRYAGLNANPVFVSTRSNGIQLFPTRRAFNYVIASVNIDGNMIVLDAANKYTLPDILPSYVLNRKGRLINDAWESMEFDLIPKMNSREMISIMAQIDTDGKVTGQARDFYHDHIARSLREALKKVKIEDYVEKLESAFAGTTISNYKLSNDKDPSKVLTEQYDFVNTMAADVAGNKIYFSPMLFYAKEENPFRSETRDYPIDFTYPVKKRHNISITLPEGYKIESMPEPISIVMDDNIGSYKYGISVTDNLLQVSATLEINMSTVLNEYYETLKAFFKKMINKQNEKVVLTKIQK